MTAGWDKKWDGSACQWDTKARLSVVRTSAIRAGDEIVRERIVPKTKANREPRQCGTCPGSWHRLAMANATPMSSTTTQLTLKKSSNAEAARSRQRDARWREPWVCAVGWVARVQSSSQVSGEQVPKCVPLGTSRRRNTCPPGSSGFPAGDNPPRTTPPKVSNQAQRGFS